jgi:hypothetical protein
VHPLSFRSPIAQRPPDRSPSPSRRDSIPPIQLQSFRDA